MAKRIKDKFPCARFVFANTGQENNETLDFVHRCDVEWGLGVTWIEAVFDLRHGHGVTHKIVTYETATRLTDPFPGTPFDMLMQKNGIVTVASPKCTDRLKGMPITHWKKVNGLAKAKHAIGIRADESERCFYKSGPKKGQKKTFWYPLCDDWPTTKEEVNAFWETQSFRLSLCEHFGNCAWCFKKSMRKLRMVALERPSSFDFPAYAEATYGADKPMFRGKMTVADIKDFSLPLLDQDRESSACVDSCEPF